MAERDPLRRLGLPDRYERSDNAPLPCPGRLEPSRSFRWAMTLITFSGVGGLLGPFLAAHRLTAHAHLLQIVAVIWFLGCGVVKITLELRRGPRSRRR